MFLCLVRKHLELAFHFICRVEITGSSEYMFMKIIDLSSVLPGNSSRGSLEMAKAYHL